MATFTDQPPVLPSSGPQNTLFPIAFNVYKVSSVRRRYTIGEHQDQPLYCVTRHGGLFSSKPNVILHSELSENSPPLATADRDGGFSRNSTMSIPIPGALVNRPGQSSAPLRMTNEQLNYAHSFGSSPTFSFTIVLESSQQRESFIWRHSHGEDVKRLGGSSTGWKLVRHAAQGPGSSDGREVVAVWSMANRSLTKMVNFAFIGSGATGELGPRWAVMAVMTALKLWDRELARRSAAAGAGAAGAAGGGGGA